MACEIILVRHGQVRPCPTTFIIVLEPPCTRHSLNPPSSPSSAHRIQTEWNTEGRMQGHLDSPLTAEGVAVASVAGRRLGRLARTWRPDVVVSSDLGRTQATATALYAGAAEACGTWRDVPLKLDARLRERCFGDAQGYTRGEILAGKVGGAPIDLDQMGTDARGASVRGGGETIEQVAERTMQCLNEIAGQYRRVVIVSHGGAIKVMTRYAGVAGACLCGVCVSVSVCL